MLGLCCLTPKTFLPRLSSNFPLYASFRKHGHQIWTPSSGARLQVPGKFFLCIVFVNDSPILVQSSTCHNSDSVTTPSGARVVLRGSRHRFRQRQTVGSSLSVSSANRSACRLQTEIFQGTLLHLRSTKKITRRPANGPNARSEFSASPMAVGESGGYWVRVVLQLAVC